MEISLLRKLLKSKIHRAVVTGAELDYEGSIGVDAELLRAVDIAENESVHVWNISNGQRVETYAIAAAPGQREIVLNGAAARLFHPGDQVIIASFCWLDESELARHQPKIALLDEHNNIAKMLPE